MRAVARLVWSGAAGMSAVAMSLGLGGCKSDVSISHNDRGMKDAEAKVGAHPGLSDVDFMSGEWRAMDKDGMSEEVWSVPHGNSIVGTFRVVGADGGLRMQEVLAIVAEPEGVFMRLRHFDAKMVSREEKDAPIVLKLEKAEGERGVFRCVSGSKSLATITYWRIEQTLHSEVAFTPESKREALRFEMGRLAARRE